MPFRSFPPPPSSSSSSSSCSSKISSDLPLPSSSSSSSSSAQQRCSADLHHPFEDSPPFLAPPRSPDAYSFGAFRQRHSDFSSRPSRLARTRSSELLPQNPLPHTSTFCPSPSHDPLPPTTSAEHPSPFPSLPADNKVAQFGSSLPSSSSSSSSFNSSSSSSGMNSSEGSLPVDIAILQHRPSTLQRNCNSISSDLGKEETWERKKEQNFSFSYDDDDEDDGCHELCEPDEVYDADDDGDDDAFHDCDEEDWEISQHHHVHHAPTPRKSPIVRRPLQRTRTRSLTDEDLDELRGSIELGFSFSHHESSNLKSTLPALELYYAINRQYEDSKGRGSPITPLERTSSAGSNGSISNETWRISSPGDHPTRVKTRLRHWAQVVACSIKQSF